MNLHKRIMNLSCAPREHEMLALSEAEMRAYKLGHRSPLDLKWEAARAVIAAVEKAQ